MEESNEEDDEVEAEDEEDEEMLSNDKEGETEMQDDATVYNEIKTEMIDNHNMEDNPKRTHGVTTIEKDDQVRPEVVGLVAGSPGKLAAAVAQTAKRHNRRMAAQAKASLNSKSLNVKNKTIKFHEYKVSSRS